MKYIYAPSYPSIRLICYFIQRGEEVTVITANPDIIKLCEMMKWLVITFNYELENQPRVYEIWNPIKIFKFKKNLDILFSQISSKCIKGQFYFTMLCIDLLGLDLVSRFALLRKDLDVTYWREGKSGTSKKVLPNNIRSLAQLAYFNILYQPRFHYKEAAGGRFVFAQDNFLSRYNIKELIRPDIHDLDVFSDLSISNLAGATVIIGGYSLEMDSMIYEIEDLKDIYNFIAEKVPSVYYKPHPGCENKIGSFFDSYNILPAYVPSEFLVNSVKVFIAGATTSMNYLAKSGARCISILDLVRTKSTFDKEEWKKKMLFESNNKIKFVQSREELRKYLLN